MSVYSLYMGSRCFATVGLLVVSSSAGPAGASAVTSDSFRLMVASVHNRLRTSRNLYKRPVKCMLLFCVPQLPLKHLTIAFSKGSPLNEKMRMTERCSAQVMSEPTRRRSHETDDERVSAYNGVKYVVFHMPGCCSLQGPRAFCRASVVKRWYGTGV